MAITTQQQLAASQAASTSAVGAPTSTETIRNVLLAYISENGGVNLASPGAIGATTPGTGAFTTLSASGALTLGTSGILSGGTNLIEQRNDTSAQAFRVYNTTNAGTTNYERLELGSTAVGANTLAVVTSKGGTGTNRALYIGTLGGASVFLMTSGTSRWAADSNGHFVAMADNAYDIGATGATRPRNVFVGGNGTFGGTLITTPNTLTGAGAISISTGTTGYISTGAAQAITLADGANGQIKTIIHTSDGGSGVLTPTTKPSTYTTITFTNLGDSVTLQFITGVGWCIIGIYGAVAA